MELAQSCSSVMSNCRARPSTIVVDVLHNQTVMEGLYVQHLQECSLRLPDLSDVDQVTFETISIEPLAILVEDVKSLETGLQDPIP